MHIFWKETTMNKNQLENINRNKIFTHDDSTTTVNYNAGTINTNKELIYK